MVHENRYLPLFRAALTSSVLTRSAGGMKRKAIRSSIWSISPGGKVVLVIRSLGRDLLVLSHQNSSTLSVGDGERNGYPLMQGTCTNTEQTVVPYW